MCAGIKIEGLAARLFGLTVRGREQLYRHGVLRPEVVEGITVISIGNVAMGGTGKTPLSLYLAKTLTQWNEKVAVVLRGYGGNMVSSGGVVSWGDGPIVSAEASGDEAYLLARRLPGVMVRVGANRVEQVRAAKEAGVTVAILDDGFQHRRIHRQLDILLATPEHLFGDARLFPEGELRDYPASAGRADLIGGFSADWGGTHGELPDFEVETVPLHLEDRDGRHRDLASVRGKRGYLITGIARPERFVETVRGLGVEVCGHTAFRDHHGFCDEELFAAMKTAKEEGADLLLTTEKDWVRLPDSRRALNPDLLSLVAGTAFTKGEAVLLEAVRTVLNRE